MINKYFLAFFLATALVGCGGSGEDLSSSFNADGTGGGSGGTTNQSAEGLWSGVITKTDATDAMPSAGIVLSSGDYFFATGTNYTSLIVGKGSTYGSTFTSTNAYNPDKSVGFIQGTISGTVTTKSKLKPELKDTSSKTVASGDLNYLDTYTNTPYLESLYGKTYTSTNPDDIKSFTLLEKYKGGFEFLDSKCYYSGTLSTSDYSKNFYQLTLAIAQKGEQTSCLNPTITNNPIKGYAFIKAADDKFNYLYLMGINDSKDRWFSGAFKQTTP